MAQRFKAKTLLSNSGVFNNEVIAPNLTYNTGNQIISGIKTFATGIVTSGNIEVSGTGIFNALDLNNIDNLNLSGIDITITSGVVNVSGGNLKVEGNIINSGIADIFPASETKRRYPPQGLATLTTSANMPSGWFQYFPFLIKKDAVNPKICVEVVATNSTNTPIRYGIYSGNNGFEGAKLFFSGSINALNAIGVYTGDINTTLIKGPYIIATSNTGVSVGNPTFRVSSVNSFREHFGDPSGTSTLFGASFGATVNYYETGIDLPTVIGSGLMVGVPVAPLPALIY